MKDGETTDAIKKIWHKSIKKIGEDYEGLRFNTAISQMMIFVNEAYKTDVLPLQAMQDFAQLMAPIAPHIAEELWERLGGSEGITYAAWPQADEAWTVDSEVEIVVQVNGKIVERLKIAADLSEEAMEEAARALEKVQAAIEGKTVRKVIRVKGKLVNIVAN